MYRLVRNIVGACLAAFLFATPLLAEEQVSKEPTERGKERQGLRDQATPPRDQDEQAKPSRDEEKQTKPPRDQGDQAMPAKEQREQPVAPVADVAMGLSNRSNMPISVEANAATRIVYVRSWLTPTATTVFQGETRQISLPSGTWQVLADGIIAGPPMTLLPGRAYSIELLTQVDLTPKAVQVRMLDDQRIVLTSWIGPRGGTQVVFLGHTATTPIYQMRFICPSHPMIVSAAAGSCSICATALVERSVLWAPMTTQTVLLHVCPRHAEVQSAFPGDCSVCSSQLIEKQVVVTRPAYVLPTPVMVTTPVEAR